MHKKLFSFEGSDVRASLEVTDVVHKMGVQLFNDARSND